jgi:hypothetical protein
MELEYAVACVWPNGTVAFELLFRAFFLNVRDKAEHFKTVLMVPHFAGLRYFTVGTARRGPVASSPDHRAALCQICHG